jgi:membrane protease YdiL (CAAX protease family)
MLVDAFGNWAFTLLILPFTLIFLIQNFGSEFVTGDYVKLILEFVFIGMLPLVIVFVRRECWKDYGFTLINWKKSVTYGLIFVVPFMIIRVYAYLFLNYRGWSWNLNPLMFLPFFLVYGPLEAFFIVFSVYKIDRGLSSKKLFSKGLILSSILFGLMHVVNYIWYPSITLILMNYILGNIIPALFVGLIFKKSYSILGSVLFWSLLNFF